MASQASRVKLRTSGGNHFDPIWTALQGLQLTDFTVRFPQENFGSGAEEVIRCHKIVLAAYSEYFLETLKTSVHGSDLNASVLKIKSVDFKNLIRFMYRGELDIGRAEFLGLRETAVLLRMKILLEEMDRLVLSDPTLAFPPENLETVKQEVVEEGEGEFYIIKEIERKTKSLITEVPPKPSVIPHTHSPPMPTFPVQNNSVLVTSKVGNDLIQWRAPASAVNGTGVIRLGQPQHVFGRMQEPEYYGVPLGVVGAGNPGREVVTVGGVGGNFQSPQLSQVLMPFTPPFAITPHQPVNVVPFRAPVHNIGQILQQQQRHVMMMLASTKSPPLLPGHNGNLLYSSVPPFQLPPPPPATMTPIRPTAGRKRADYEKEMERLVTRIIAKEATPSAAARELKVSRSTVVRRVAKRRRQQLEQM